MEPDLQKFPLLRAAFSVLEKGDTASAIILNAADEVSAFPWGAHYVPIAGNLTCPR